MQVDQSAAAFFCNAMHRPVNYVVASAPARAEDIANETMREHAHQHGLVACLFYVALNHRDVRVPGDLRLVRDHAEFAISGWNNRLSQSLDVALVRHAIAD